MGGAKIWSSCPWAPGRCHVVTPLGQPQDWPVAFSSSLLASSGSLPLGTTLPPTGEERGSFWKPMLLFKSLRSQWGGQQRFVQKPMTGKMTCKQSGRQEGSVERLRTFLKCALGKAHQSDWPQTAWHEVVPREPKDWSQKTPRGK